MDGHDQRDALRCRSLLCVHASEHSQNAQTVATVQAHKGDFDFTAVGKDIMYMLLFRSFFFVNTLSLIFLPDITVCFPKHESPGTPPTHKKK